MRSASVWWAVFSIIVCVCGFSVDAIAVRLSASPTKITFLGTKIGFSNDQFCRVTNLAPVGIQVDAAQIAGGDQLDFTLISPTTKTFLIAAKDSAFFLVRFKPQQPGMRQSFLQLMTSDGELDIELDGTGLGKDPRLITRPSSIDFGIATPGTTHDSVFYLIATGPDTAVITNFLISNFSGGLYFSTKFFDPNRTLPIILVPGDSLELIAEFSAAQPLGTKTGEIAAEGDVTDSAFCLLKGDVELPDILVTPSAIDYGTRYRGSTVDTLVLISNPSRLPLQIDDIQPLTYGWSLIAPIPTLPDLIAPGATLTLHLRFTPPAIGTFNYSLAIFAHATASGGNYRAVQLLAKVIDVPLIVASKQSLIYNCALDSVVSGGFTLEDTAQASISITNLLLSDSLISISEIVPGFLPLTLGAGQRLDLHFKHLNAADTNNRLIVKTLNGDVVLRSDTFSVTTAHSSIIASQKFDPIDIQTMSTKAELEIANDVRGFKLHTIVAEIESINSDAFSIDQGSFKLNASLIPSGAITRMETTANGAIVTISAPVGIAWSSAAASNNWLLRYTASAFVAIKNTALVSVAISSPELGGCLIGMIDTTVVVIPGSCTDPLLREKLADAPIMTNITVNPNPAMNGNVVLSLRLSEQAWLIYSVVDATGHIVVSGSQDISTTGRTEFPIIVSAIPSGAYEVLVNASGIDGSKQHSSVHLLKLR
jgi:hypothetical protein